MATGNAPGLSPDEGSRHDTWGRIHVGGGAEVRRVSAVAVARRAARLGLILIAEDLGPERSSSSADPVLAPIDPRPSKNDAPGTRPPKRLATRRRRIRRPVREVAACRTTIRRAVGRDLCPAGPPSESGDAGRGQNHYRPGGPLGKRCRTPVAGMQRVQSGKLVCYKLR